MIERRKVMKAILRESVKMPFVTSSALISSQLK